MELSDYRAPVLRAIIFDLDGTLADTLPVCFLAFRATFQMYTGREWSDAEVEALFGITEEGMIRSVVGESKANAAIARYLSEYEQSHSICLEPFAGVVELLDRIQRSGLKTAIVTGKGPHSAEISLRRLGLRDRFEIVETGSAEAPNKPEAIRRVLERWNVEPYSVAYVGDAPGDIKAAREVGMIAHAAAWAVGSRPEELAAMQPDELFRTVEDLSAWIEGRRGPAA